MRRALVTLAHPAARRHAARAARPRRRGAGSWLELRFVLPGAASAAGREVGIPADAHRPSCPASRAGAGSRARSCCPRRPAARAAGARRRRALLDDALDAFRTATSRARLARVPQVVHVYSSYGERAAVPQALARAGAPRHRAVGRLAARWRERAVGGFAPGTRTPASPTTAWTSRGIAAQAEAAPPPAGARRRARGSAWSATSTGGRTRALLVEAAPAIRAAVPDVRVAAHRRLPATRRTRRACADASPRSASTSAVARDRLPAESLSRSCGALDVLVAPGAARSVPARAARGHGARASDRRVGGRRHPGDAGRRRERSCWSRPTTPAALAAAVVDAAARRARAGARIGRGGPRAARAPSSRSPASRARCSAPSTTAVADGASMSGARVSVVVPDLPARARCSARASRACSAQEGVALRGAWSWTTARPTTRRRVLACDPRPARCASLRIAARRRRGGAQRRHRGERGALRRLPRLRRPRAARPPRGSGRVPRVASATSTW